MAAPVRMGFEVKEEKLVDFLIVDMMAPMAKDWYTVCVCWLCYVKVFYMKDKLRYTIAKWRTIRVPDTYVSDGIQKEGEISMSIFKKGKTAQNHTEYTNPYGDQTGYTNAPKAKKNFGWLWRILVLIVFIVCMVNAVEVIPSGYTGVVSTFGQIQEKPMPNGFNWKIPFVQEVKQVNNKQQDIYIDGQIWSEAQDQTVVYMQGVTVTYQISPEKSAWIYANVTDYTRNLVSNTLVSSAMKMATKTLATENVTNRSIIEPVAKESLQNALDEKYGADTVHVIKVVISDMDFEQKYNDAIEARQLAKMEQERQAIENATNLAKAQAQAEAARVEAQGKADAEAILAQGKADANKILSESITSLTQMQDVIENWDGQLPSTLVSDGDGGIFKMFAIPSGDVQNNSGSVEP